MITGVKLNGTQKISYSYDGLNRLSTRNLNNFLTEYTYLQGANANSTTTLVSSIKNGNETLSYTYDELGNITSISKNGTIIECYTYDVLNQLKTVTRGTDTYTYNYDNGGNILSVTKNGTAIKSYTYGDAEWRDLLTAYNGQPITYDNIGNPLNYYDGSTFTWSDGRKLTNIVNSTDNISYAYDSNGLRASKTVNGTVTEYYWLDGTLYAEKTGNRYIYFHYDDNSLAYGFTVVNGTTTTDYYYIHNLQGDVIGILDTNGTKVVEYTYDEWGKILATTGSLATTIGELNPFRYRGYYYDTETGFYYCRARYYDPEICRWISADGQMSGVGGKILGYNQFAYCFNNPINLEDSTGTWPKWIEKAANTVKQTFNKIIKSTIEFTAKVIADVVCYDKDNTDIEKVYKSNYFSSYNGTLVIRHSIEDLTSCAIGGTIYLNHNEDQDSLSDRTNTLNHEYGHILQEKECGTFEYIFKIAIPSLTYFFVSQNDKDLSSNYYNMPWEYDADMRGGVNRGYSSWAETTSNIYFFVWDYVI